MLAAGFLCQFASATEFRTTREQVIVYDSPSQKSRRLSILSPDYPVEVLDRDEDGWLKVRDMGGDIGWIDEQSTTVRKRVIVRSPNAEILRLPDTNSRLAFRAERGVILERLSIPDEEGWIRVRIPNGRQEGYIKTAQVWGVERKRTTAKPENTERDRLRTVAISQLSRDELDEYPPRRTVPRYRNNEAPRPIYSEVRSTYKEVEPRKASSRSLVSARPQVAARPNYNKRKNVELTEAEIRRCLQICPKVAAARSRDYKDQTAYRRPVVVVKPLVVVKPKVSVVRAERRPSSRDRDYEAAPVSYSESGDNYSDSDSDYPPPPTAVERKAAARRAAEKRAAERERWREQRLHAEEQAREREPGRDDNKRPMVYSTRNSNSFSTRVRQDNWDSDYNDNERTNDAFLPPRIHR